MKIELDNNELEIILQSQHNKSEALGYYRAQAEHTSSDLRQDTQEDGNEFPKKTLKFISQVMSLSKSGQVLAAIKLVREKTGCGLKEAKDAVDGNAH